MLLWLIFLPPLSAGLPSFLVSSKAVSAVESLWIILIGMVLFTATVPATGHFLVDRGLPKIWTYLLASIVIGAVVVPFMIGIGSHSVGKRAINHA